MEFVAVAENLPGSVSRVIPPGLAFCQPRKAIDAPFFAADAVVHEEEALGIIFRFYALQSRVVRPPEQERSKKLLSETYEPASGATLRSSAID